MTVDTYQIILTTMIFLAMVVFVCLQFIEVGYGITRSGRWGWAIRNKIGWMMMESTAFLGMFFLWYYSDYRWDPVRICFFFFFEIHYFRRAFLFPLRMKGYGTMPVSVMTMGFLFNGINAFLLGGWLFHFAPEDLYLIQWLHSPQFIIGTLLFFGGMGINISSDSIIRSLRKEGDSNHYLPEKGLFKYVTSAHYFGEIIEWIGFAILTWSAAGAVFVFWTMANLIPRANVVYKKYRQMFGTRVVGRKRIFPYLY